MVSIFVGSGSGFARGSGNIVGGAGLLGSGTQGRGGDNVSVNAATGNLLISRQDEFLVGRGPDASISRTYNSLAQMSDGDNGDQWQQSTMRRVFGLTGTLNTAGSTVSRQGGDGSLIIYAWDAAKSAYVTTDGDGAHDKLVKSGATWIWTDGSSQWTETYEASFADAAVFRIKEQKDTDGNKLGFTYVTGTDKLDMVTTMNHGTANADTGIAEQSYVKYDWTGDNITQVITGYTDYGADPASLADNVNRTLTRTRYTYDASNRLKTVIVDLTPEVDGLADDKTYVTSYTYDGASDRVASITQTDGSSLAITYDASGRVATLTQAVAGSDVRVTRFGYGVNVSSITGPDGQVTRMWYDNRGQLVQLMSPPVTPGGLSQVRQFEYDASGNLIRTIETDSANASTPNNLVQAASWGDGEGADRGDNLVDDSGWPQDVDGTLPANGTIGQGWTGAYTGETEWTVTTGPYGKQIISLHAGQADTADGGGGAYSLGFPIDKSKAYEFTLYFKADELNKHQVYFGLGSGVVKNGSNGAYDGNPYFTTNLPGSGMEAGKWYKIVGYVLPGSTPLEAAGSYGGIYDVETGERIKTVKHFVWDETQTGTTSVARFFNFYNTQNQGKFTHFFKPEVREVADAAILRGNEALDIVRDRNLLEVPYPAGWVNTSTIAGDGEARWEEMLGPDGAWQIGLQTGQFDAAADGGGAYTNQITIDPTKAYRFTQYVRKSDLTRHNIYFGLTSSSTPYVKNAATGAADTNPYFLGWAPVTQQANMDADGWYKIVGYVLPEGSANIAAGSLGGIYDAETGERVADAVNFRWNEGRANDQVYARFFTYYDQTLPGWSTDWMTPEVLEIDGADLAADNASPFGVTYDEGGRIALYTYDAMGNMLTSKDANDNLVTRTYGAKNELLTETRTGSDASGGSVSHTTRYVYDSENHLRYRISPEGRVTEYRYFSPGALQSIFEYPEHSYPAGTVAPSDTAMNGWRDGLPDRSSVEISIYSYDGRDNLYYTVNYGAATTAGATSTTEGYSRIYYSYDQSGRLLNRYNLGENAETFVYDGMGRLTGSTDLAGGTTTIVFNDAALTTTVTTGAGYVSTSTHNKAGDLVSETHSGSYLVAGTTAYRYDKLGRVRMVTTPLGVATTGNANDYNSFILYDNAGRKTADIAADGSVVEYRYDAAGRLAATIGYATRLGATQMGNLAAAGGIADIGAYRPGGTASDIWNWNIYDDGGRLIQSIDGNGGVVDFVYDASNQLIKTISYAAKLAVAAFKTALPTTRQTVVAGVDRVARSFYDADGQLIGALDGEGYLSEIVYDKAGRKVDEVAYATQTSAALWAAGTFAQLRTSASPSTATTRHMRYVYDGQGLLRYTVDNAGYVSSLAYNYAGKHTSTIVYAAPIAPATSDFTYDNIKALVSPPSGIANPANDRQSYSVYNAKGEVAYTIGAAGTVTGYTYDIAGNVIKTVRYAAVRATTALPVLATMDTWATGQASNADNVVTRSWYSAGGDLRFSVDGEGYRTEYVYDADGNLLTATLSTNAVSVTDATTIAQLDAMAAGASITTTSTYDPTGRLLSVTDAEGGITTYEYNAFGQIVKVTDPRGQANGKATYRYYDAAGRLVTVRDTEDYVTQTTYNGFGEILGVTRFYNKTASAVSTTTTPVVVANAAKDVVTWTYYDELGRLLYTVDGEQYVTRSWYNGFGEVMKVARYATTYNATATTTIAQLDAVFGAESAVPPATAAVTSFEYDSRGLVKKATDAEGFFENYGYDGFGNRTSVVAKSKDATKVAGGTTVYVYDKRGLLLSETLPTSSYNADGSVQGAIVNTYAYDALGNRTQMVEATGLAEARTTTYEYDRLGRLTATKGQARPVLDQTNHVTVTASFVPTETVAYDAAGNIVSVTDAAGGRSVYFYDDIGRKTVAIDAAGTYTRYAYDANGNVTSTRVYEQKVASIPASGGSDAAAGAAAPGTVFRETLFTYDNLSRLLTSSVAGAKTGSYAGGVWTGVTTPIATVYEYDAFGNVVKTTDANGGVGWSYYDRSGRKTHQVDALNYMTTWTYDNEGHVLVETRYANPAAAPAGTATPPANPATNAADRITSFTYDKNGNRLSEARSKVVIHNGSGGVTDANGVTVTITWLYNGLGQVVQKSEATDDPYKNRGEVGDESIYYAYDVGGRLLTEERAAFTNHLGAVVRPVVDYRYNGLGDLARTVAAGTSGDVDQRETRYTYGAGGLLATMTDAENVVHSYSYDKRGTLISDEYLRAGSAGGAGTRNAVLTKVDALGRTIEQSVAAWSGTAWTKGDIATTEYNAYGEVGRSGINGLWQTENKYDAAGRLWATNAGDGVWKIFGYDKNGNRTIAIANAGWSLTGKTFDQAFAEIASTANGAAVNATFTVYDKRNMATSVVEEGRQLASSADSQTLTSSRSYNAFGDVTTETDARGAVTSYTYNTIGKLVRSEGPTVEATYENGATQWIKPATDYYYDKSGRLVATRDANGTYAAGGTSTNGVSKLAGTGNLTRLTLLAGTGYNGTQALVTAETHADGGVKTSKYDIHGDARVLIDEVNRTTTQIFDKMGRLTQVSHAGGLIDNYGYDSLGQRITHWNNFLGSVDKETNDYDVQGRVTITRAFGGDVTSISYTWDATIAATGMGITTGGWTEVTTMANSRTLTEKSDIFGRATWKEDLGDHVTTYAYDIAGRQTSSTMGGLTATFTYLNTGLIKTNGGPNGTATYSYDAAGNRLTEVLVTGGVTIKNQSATYDAMGRLKTWTEAGTVKSPAASTTHSYDAVGNIRRTQTSQSKLNATGGVTTPETKDYWFAFDSMNRLVVDKGMLVGAVGGATTIIRARDEGTETTYNAAGERMTSRSKRMIWGYIGRPSNIPGEPGHIYYPEQRLGVSLETYTYDAAGRLTKVQEAASTVSGETDTAIYIAEPTGPGQVRSELTYDLMGRLTSQKDYGGEEAVAPTFNGVSYSRDVSYNAKSQVTSDTVSTLKARLAGSLGTVYDTFKSVTSYTYGSGTSYALGSVVTQSAVNTKLVAGTWSSDPSTLTTTVYAWYDGAVQDRIVHDSNTGDSYNPDPLDPAHFNTRLIYNGFGQLTGADVNDGVAKDVTYTLDETGQIIRRDESRSSAPSEAAPHEVFYRFAGRQMGMTGNDGTSDVNYSSSVLDRSKYRDDPTSSTAGLFRDGTKTGTIAYADFTQSYDPYNTGYQGSAGGNYTVRQGDTLQGIAANLYGDANLWYKIANANGMSANSALAEGQTLTLPVGVTRNTHSADTFRPYDPVDAIGDLSPTTPKPPKKPQCGVLGMILVAAIAIGVAALLGPQMIAAFSSTTTTALSGAAAAGLGGLSGVAVTTTSISAFGAIAAGAVTGAVTSAVSQGVGVAVGAQDKFSWKGVGLAALSGGISGGVTPGANIPGRMAVGAGVNAATQGIGAAAGLQSKFDFAGVAAAGVAAGIGAEIGGAAANAGLGRIGASIVANTASGIANAATRSAFNGNSFGDNLIRALPDIIGGTISDGLSGRYAVRGSGAAENAEAGKTVNTPKDDPTAKTGGTFGTVAAAAVTGSMASVAGAGSRQAVTGAAVQFGIGAGSLDKEYFFQNNKALDNKRAKVSLDDLTGEIVVTAPIRGKYAENSGAFSHGLGASIGAKGGIQYWGGPKLGVGETLMRFAGAVGGGFYDLGMGFAGGVKLVWDAGSFDRETAMAARGQIFDMGRRTVNGEIPQALFGATVGAADQFVVHDNPLPLIRGGTGLLAGGALGKIASLRTGGVVAAKGTPLAYDISKWGEIGLPSDGRFVRTLTREQYRDFRAGREFSFGGQPVEGYPGGMGFIGSAEEVRGITSASGYRDALQLSYDPKFVMEFQLRDYSGLQNVIRAPYAEFVPGGRTGAGYVEYNLPGITSRDIVNGQVRILK